MRRRSLPVLIILLFSLLAQTNLSAQAPDTLVTWKVDSKKTGEGKFELTFTTSGAAGWQVYSPDQVISEIKMAELVFADSSILLEGTIQPVNAPQTVNSPIFGAVKVQEGPAEWKATVSIPGTIPATLQGSLQFYYGKGDEFVTARPFTFQVALEGGVSKEFAIKVASIDINNPVSDCGDDGTKNKSLLTIFLLGLAGGLIALLTPCVFPMIPVTVTFFTKKSQDRKQGVANAVMYGLFIFLIYVLITVPFHLAGNTNPEIFNNISTNVWLNLAFFAIFVAFALSFFGLFEIGLPASLANKADSKSGLGNIAGIFFMATTLAIVSFSCTGPILGTLLVGVANQGAWPLTVGAAGFGLALGLPFALFALFPNWLQSLPRSGGWMTDVKVVLGFVELALAIKFLSNADLVQQWGLIKREIFIGSWALISLLVVLYLLGILKIGHSGPVKKFGITRIIFIALFSAFTVYLIPGVTNTKYANLKWISGFPPPLCYSIYKEPVNCVTGFKPLENEYELALEKAKQENKPVLIDFTGWACVNCRKMEESVWTDPKVQELMRDEFVVVSLYVDERRKLPLNEQMVYKDSSGKEKPIITVGDKWATFQTVNFGATSQPQYAILSADQVPLTRTKYYTPDPREFEAWLKCGIEAGKKK
ncbi:MAG: thioredoxin family protein [Chitinophagales bacterium]|nr:thioredoxin family protein [Chitinophagales bacterium]